MSERLLRLSEVIEKIGLSRSEIYKRMARGDFPNSVQLGARSVAWTESSLDKWIFEQVRDSAAIVKEGKK